MHLRQSSRFSPSLIQWKVTGRNTYNDSKKGFGYAWRQKQNKKRSSLPSAMTTLSTRTPRQRSLAFFFFYTKRQANGDACESPWSHRVRSMHFQKCGNMALYHGRNKEKKKQKKKNESNWRVNTVVSSFRMMFISENNNNNNNNERQQCTTPFRLQIITTAGKAAPLPPPAQARDALPISRAANE